MKNDNIRIKQKKSDFLLFGFVYLFLILAGIFLIGLPSMSIAPSDEILSIVFLSIGILFVAGGSVMYGILLYHGICPKDALIITNKGFTNKMIGGKEGVYVEWVNISSMKVFGLTKAPMLGLTLADNEAYISSLSGKSAKDARANLELGLPVIAISQRDVFLKIPELKNLFSRMIKGAISWEQYASHNKKAELHTEEVLEINRDELPEELADNHESLSEIIINAETVSPLSDDVTSPETTADEEDRNMDLAKTREIESTTAKESKVRSEAFDEILELDMDDE